MTKPTVHGRPSIRPFEPSDAPELFALVSAQGDDLDAFAWRQAISSQADESAFIDWACRAEEAGVALNRAIVVNGRLAGCASLYPPHHGAFPSGAEPTLQMGYWVAREFRGQGLAWRSMSMLCAQALAIFPPSSTAGIRSRSGNGASLACAAKLGLELVCSGMPSEFDSADTDVAMSGLLSTAAMPSLDAKPKRPPRA